MRNGDWHAHCEVTVKDRELMSAQAALTVTGLADHEEHPPVLCSIRDSALMASAADEVIKGHVKSCKLLSER